MNRNAIVHTALAVALFGLPSAALADQPSSNPWYGNGQQNQHSDRDRNRADRDDRNRADRDDRNRADRDDRNRADRDDRNRDRDSNGNYGYNRSGRLNGTVSGFGGYNLSLANGQQVRLHQGTVINPTGTTLQPGMRLAISGHQNGDGTFEADRVDVLDGGYRR